MCALRVFVTWRHIVHKFGKTAAATAVDVLRNLFGQPIIDVTKIQQWTNIKTRAGA